MSDNNSFENKNVAEDDPYYQNTHINSSIPQNNNSAKLRPLNRINANSQSPQFNSQNAPQNGNPQQTFYNNGGMNQYPQSPQFNGQNAPQNGNPQQTFYNNGGMNQFSQPQQFYNQNLNSIPPQYNPPPTHKNNGGKNYGTIILIVITIILIAAITAVGLFLYFRESDDDDYSDRRRNGSSSSDHVDETEPTDETKDDNFSENNASDETEPEPDSDMISVPDVEGLYYITAAEMLKEYGFHVDTQFEYSDTVAGDVVISQDIPSGTNVESGTKITIIVSQGPEHEQGVEMPNVRGLKAEDARAELEALGLSVEFEYEKSDTIASDNVIEQNTASGTMVEKGTTITLIISMGKDSQTSSDSKRMGKVVTKETALNVRKTPSADGELIGTVPKDSAVEVISEEGDWYKITFENGVGYVSKDYIQLEN